MSRLTFPLPIHDNVYLCVSQTGGLFDQTNVNTTSTQEILFELAVKHVSEYRVKKFPRVEAGKFW